MFRAPAHWHNNSLKIASVLEDIGVNERMVPKRRRGMLLREKMATIALKLSGKNISCYYFGSRSEGTTTPGMGSDVDALGCTNHVNVIQMWEEWKPGALNLMMIQDENTTLGYCFLQKLCSDEPLPVTVNEAEYKNNAIYKRDRVIMKNTFINKLIPEGQTREGAAVNSSNVIGYAVLLIFSCRILAHFSKFCIIMTPS